jgi:hypothetical protein
MGIFSVVGDVVGGIQANKIAKMQMGEGDRMLAEAKALQEGYKRPEMMTPQAIQAMVKMAQGQMYQKMPGATQFENQIQGATAQGMSAIGEMGAGAESIGALAGLYGNQMNQMQNLAAQNASYQAQGQQSYMNALQGLGDWQQQQWQWNEADPYLQAMTKAAQLEQVGYLNRFQGYKAKQGAAAEMWSGIGEGLDQTVQQAAGMATGGLGNILSLLGGGSN